MDITEIDRTRGALLIMPHVHLAPLVGVLFTGVLAGFELGVHYGIGVPLPSVPESAQIALRQALVRRLRILAPALYFPAMVSVIFVAIQERHEPGPWLRFAPIGMLLLWIAIRIVRTVPVNSATMEWNPKAPPCDWRLQVEQTERFHVVAAWGALVAFVCSLASVYALR